MIRRLPAALLLVLVLGACSPLENERLYSYSMVIRSEIKRRLPKPESVPRVKAPEGVEALLEERAPTSTPLPAATTPIEDPPTATPASTEAPTDAPAEAPTDAPSATPTQAPTATPVAEVALPVDPNSLPGFVRLTGAAHEYQRWNNCGPATLAMYLTFWGESTTQYDTEKFLKPDREDKNVTPREMAAYARLQGYEALVGVNGNLELLKLLVAAGYPVIVERWFLPFGPQDGMGHYGLVLGYDDAQGTFNLFDSYNGPSVSIPYRELDTLWHVFNRTFVLAYPAEDHDKVSALLQTAHAGFDEALHGAPAPMHASALEMARAEARADPGNAFAWFNLGSSLTALGRYEEAAQAFDQARHVGLPWRMLWYQFGPFEAYYHVGRHQDVLDLATANLSQAGNLEESYYWRGLSLRALGREDEARQAFQIALRFNPNYSAAAEALN